MNDRFYIGPFLIEPRLNRIAGPDDAVQVAPKYMHVLVCLADEAGELVTRHRLLDTVWAGTVVGEEVLTRAISELRQIFDDDARHPAVIETIRGRGYRLIASVEPAPPSTSPSTPNGTNPWSFVRDPGIARHGTLQLLILVMLAVLCVSLFVEMEPKPPVPARVVPITSDPGIESAPALSPDGRRIAFAWQGIESGDWDLYIQTLDTGDLVQLTDLPGDEGHPAWTPDGRALAFVHTTAETCQIARIASEGGALEPLTACTPGHALDLSWSPDGTRLVFSDRPDTNSPARLFVLTLGEAFPHSLTRPPATFEGDYLPAFAPDGHTVAFVRKRAFGLQDVYRVPVIGGPPERLTFDETKIGGLTWNAEADHLLFSSKRNGAFHLWAMPAQGGAASWIGTGHDNIHRPSMQNGRLVYEQWTVEANIWQLPLQHSSSPTPWLTSTRWDAQPAFSPDGSQVAFASDRTGSPEIWLADADGQYMRQLTRFSGPYTGHPRWAPDGSALVFASRVGGNADLYLYDLRRSLLRRLTTHPANDTAPCWVPNGGAVYFASNRRAGWQIWKLSLHDGTTAQITESGGYGCQAAEAPDGSFLYFDKHDASGLWRLELPAGTVEKLMDNVTPAYEQNWRVTPQGIYFVAAAPTGGSALFHEDLLQGHRILIHHFDYPLASASLTVHPDGQMLLFAQVDRSESDIMLIDFVR